MAARHVSVDTKIVVRMCTLLIQRKGKVWEARNGTGSEASVDRRTRRKGQWEIFWAGNEGV